MQPDISNTENSDFLLSLPTVRILASFAVIIRTTNPHVYVLKNSIKFYSSFLILTLHYEVYMFQII